MSALLAGSTGLADTGCEKKQAPPAPVVERRVEPQVDAAPIVACGKGDHPDCPLQMFMTRTLRPAVKASDAQGAVLAFTQLRGLAPEGWEHWPRFADRALEAIAAKDWDAVREVCLGCHDEYQERYQNELRGRPLVLEGASAPGGPGAEGPAPVR